MALFTPQTIRIYRQLSGKPTTVREIATNLHILPNVVHRSLDVLITNGFVIKQKKHPACYISVQRGGALDRYLNEVRNSLVKTLASESLSAPDLLNVSFIKDRNDFIEKTNRDLKNTMHEAKFIVSGLELPAELMYEYATAINRRVNVQIIVQNLDEAKAERLKIWRELGMQVRHYPLIEARIAVFDLSIAYITSYNPKEKEAGMGVRFAYAPIAKIMNDLFTQRWAKAKEVEYNRTA